MKKMNTLKTQMIILTACSTLGRDQCLITLPCLAGLGDYTHAPLIGICGSIFPSANGVHQTLWTGSKQFQPTDHLLVQHTGPLGGKN